MIYMIKLTRVGDHPGFDSAVWINASHIQAITRAPQTPNSDGPDCTRIFMGIYADYPSETPPWDVAETPEEIMSRMPSDWKG